MKTIQHFLLILAVLAPSLPGKDVELESLAGSGVWIDPRIENLPEKTSMRVTVWFEKQFLGNGSAYLRRTKDFDGIGRTEMRQLVMRALKDASAKSQKRAQRSIEKLEATGDVSDTEFFWIVNGFSCRTHREGVAEIAAQVPGVRKIFYAGPAGRASSNSSAKTPASAFPGQDETTAPPFDPEAYPPLWFVTKLKADRVWKEFGVTGKGTLNVVHDGNFVLSPWTVPNLYRNQKERVNGKDDDGNGLIDDLHGYDFSRRIGGLTRVPLPKGPIHRNTMRTLHGHECVGIICGRASKKSPHQPGVAPESKWAGVLASQRIEAAVQWAVENEADTYSMSFSRPNMADGRSHWRKIMEHGSYCGVHFVSGAGNFAQKGSPSFAPVPRQMRIPEDIPHAVFAAAGVQQDLSRTPFSSQGPVEWKTEHYGEGRVDKPEVCAFNYQIPLLDPNGGIAKIRTNGNSFAGPMYCGTIALILSANPELKPWESREILIRTATDIAEPGYDFQTGHGLLNAYEAVKLTLANLAAE